MPPYTILPRPEGHINLSYSPMSPPNWGIAGSAFHYSVYRNAKVALQSLLQAVTTIQAQRLEAGTAQFFTDHLFYRGQSEITQRLLPTRLRGPYRQPMPRERFSVDNPPKITFNGQEFPRREFKGPPGIDPKEHFGNWFEEVEPVRQIEDSAAELSEKELKKRDAEERKAIQCANKIAEIAALDPFRKRAAVRHYSHTKSSLLDVSTNPEVAAFFATGGGSSSPPPAGQIGMIWAIDLNYLDDLFSFQIIDVPGGIKIIAREQRDKWGVNKGIFEDFGIEPVAPEITFVALPFRRPLAQHARFFSLCGEDGKPLPLLTELAWWSILERRSFCHAFIQDGVTYENPSHNITKAALLPDHETLAAALAKA